MVGVVVIGGIVIMGGVGMVWGVVIGVMFLMMINRVLLIFGIFDFW